MSFESHHTQAQPAVVVSGKRKPTYWGEIPALISYQQLLKTRLSNKQVFTVSEQLKLDPYKPKWQPQNAIASDIISLTHAM
jgi:hypothetical protein